MAKRSRTSIQAVSINDVNFDDEPATSKIKYEIEDESDAINYEDGTQEIKVEPDVEYDYSEYQEDDDENAEYVITELDDPDMLDLKPFKKPEPKPSSSSSGKYRCTVCTKSFQYLRSYNQHRLVHVLRSDHTTCEICHKELKRTALEYHMKYRHIDARNFQCQVCLNRFKSPGALRHHIATFHPSEGYDCDECERVFKSRELLLKHKGEEHVFKPVKQEKFDCESCNKTFQNQGQLTLHVGILGKKLGKCRDTL